MQTKSLLNGVDLTKFVQTIEAMIKKPELGKYQFRVNNQWLDGGYNQSVIKDFLVAGEEDTIREVPFILSSDEPDALLGNDHAPSPVEFILHALAGSLTTSLVYHAAARGYEISKIETEIEGRLDMRGYLGIDNWVRKGFEEITVSFDIEGSVSEEEKKEILKLTSFSPVFDIITNPVPVKIKLDVKEPAELIDC